MLDRKYKIPNYQNGHAYLTSHRVCYVSADEPRNYCVGIDLKEIDRAEYQVRMLSCFDAGTTTNPTVILGPFPEVVTQGNHLSETTE